MVKESVLIHSFAGMMGSLSIQILHPFDVIKTRAQAYDKKSNFNNVSQYKNIYNSFINIVKNEGVRSLYKGIGISIVASNISYGIFFGLYRGTKNFFDKIENKKICNFVSGFVSSVIAVGLVQPLWTLKTRKIIDQSEFKKSKYKNLISELYKKDGIKGFYRGYTLSLILGLNAVIQLSFYDSIKDFYMEKFKKVDNLFTFVNGIISRMFATLAMYPFNTMRTKIQQNQHFEGMTEKKYKNIKDVFFYILEKEGLKGFYRGIIPHLFRSMPSNGLFFIVYENTVKTLKNR